MITITTGTSQFDGVTVAAYPSWQGAADGAVGMLTLLDVIDPIMEIFIDDAWQANPDDLVVHTATRWFIVKGLSAGERDALRDLMRVALARHG